MNGTQSKGICLKVRVLVTDPDLVLNLAIQSASASSSLKSLLTPLKVLHSLRVSVLQTQAMDSIGLRYYGTGQIPLPV